MPTRQDVKNHTSEYLTYQRANNARFRARNRDRIVQKRRTLRRKSGIQIKGSPEWLANQRIQLTSQNPFYWSDFWNPQRVHFRRPRWQHSLIDRVRYNETALLIEEGATCEISGCSAIASNVDHSHQTNLIRGALCTRHNIAIGFIEKLDLQRILNYLNL